MTFNREQEIKQAITLRCKLIGIRLGGGKNISKTKVRQLLKKAKKFTGINYKRSELQKVNDDLNLFINSFKEFL